MITVRVSEVIESSQNIPFVVEFIRLKFDFTQTCSYLEDCVSHSLWNKVLECEHHD